MSDIRLEPKIQSGKRGACVRCSMGKIVETKYFKKVCPKHPELMGERWRATRACVACTKESKRIYREKNKVKISEKYKIWLSQNKEKRAVYCKKWGEDHKEWWLAYNKRQYAEQKEVRTKNLKLWRKNNKEKMLATAKTHKIIRERLIAGQKLAKATAKETAEIYKNCPEGHEVDHIYPLRGKGINGLHVPWNLQYLTISENRKKHNKWT